MTPAEFIAKWGPGGPSAHLNEEQGAQTHFLDLCELLDVPKPGGGGTADEYVFERRSLILGQARGYADVFYRNHFAWENKAPGKNLDAALSQLQRYSGPLGNPPLLVVCDRLTIRVHTQFNGHPSETYIVRIDQFDQSAHRELLRRLWTDPESFRPRATNRDITEQAARSFATLAEQLRGRGHHPDQVAHFLTQCLFCFFAEDVGLLPGRMFERLVSNRHLTSERLTGGMHQLFTTMHSGGLYGPDDIPWFNGGLFQRIDVPKLEITDITELRNAAALNWSAIDVSIFGTLFERGLDPAKRSQLGAHYTDPATISRIIEPVVTRPLLQKWEQTAQELQALAAKIKKYRDAAWRKTYQRFTQWLDELSALRILDPACGSGNFLFLGLKALKDIELLSIDQAAELGLDREQDLVTGPRNVLGIELNEYAAELARVSIWIGEIQWRMAKGYPPKLNPVLEPLEQIECRDALLAWSDENGQRTASEAAWPQATVVVGNPPFLGGKKFISELGEEYANTLRQLFAGRVPGLADLVSYWFEKSRNQIASGKLSAAGLVATNSIRDGFGREVLKRVLADAPIFDAWSDEPWVNEGAAVRVSLIAFSSSKIPRHLNGQPASEISSSLREISAYEIDLTRARPLAENTGVAFQGTTRSGPFDVPGSLARDWLRLPNPNGKSNADVVRPWSNGLDVTRRPSDTWIIDFGTGMSEADASLYEKPFEHCRLYVKPTRSENRNPRLVQQWWHYDGVRVKMRRATNTLRRFITTTITAKYRTFVWLDATVLPDATLIALAREDDATFGILHSRFHELWSLRMGAWLGVGNDPRYTPTTCLETFPFPAGLTPADTARQRTQALPDGALIPAGLPPALRERASAIAQAARRLDALRQNWLNPPEWTRRAPEVIPLGLSASPYPDRIEPRPGFEDELKKRTLTTLYNQRPAWLAQAHAQLDAAVAAAYGWADYTPELSDSEILRRLLELNRARAASA
ncbi:MAG: hypothetical protein FWG56_11905 [Desulfovibrionaceae bacterium]|jgi:hypothetical protein|nr:hypothetical protein [Desulfovibrionaceae bacterium]